MSKLTRKQEENLIVLYASGTWTIRDLAKKFGLSKDTVSKILKKEEYADIRTSLGELKNEEMTKTYESMSQYFAEGRQKAQKLLDKLLNIPDELIASSTLRERVGAAHYIKEMFIDPDNGSGGEKVNVIINIEDTSSPVEDGGDN